MVDLTLPTIVLLAAADAVNPCAMAVLVLVLINILLENPKNEKKILKAGLFFSLSIFIMYFLYGIIIVQFFKTLSLFLQNLTPYIFKGVGILALILGILNIKDYFKYKPGGLGTEMPLSMRPKVKNLINKITGPTGAFLIGIFVTLFLLPCTIGPYIVAGNILSLTEFLQTIPWLLLYNLIFVMPMVIITLIIYFGVSKLEDINAWKERNIRYLHLIAGTLISIIGILMFFNLI